MSLTMSNTVKELSLMQKDHAIVKHKHNPQSIKCCSQTIQELLVQKITQLQKFCRNEANKQSVYFKSEIKAKFLPIKDSWQQHELKAMCSNCHRQESRCVLGQTHFSISLILELLEKDSPCSGFILFTQEQLLIHHLQFFKEKVIRLSIFCQKGEQDQGYLNQKAENQLWSPYEYQQWKRQEGKKRPTLILIKLLRQAQRSAHFLTNITAQWVTSISWVAIAGTGKVSKTK